MAVVGGSEIAKKILTLKFTGSDHSSMIDESTTETHKK